MRFALIGAAGYVAPRHMRAIKDVGGELVACLDPHDSVGILDSLAPGCLYFREPERFERWLLKYPVHYVVVASPNYLHDSHSIMGMRAGADVICEKPLVCNERNLDQLLEIEQQTGKRVWNVLQCRLHPAAIRAKESVPWSGTIANVDYVTPRGPWYSYSWKGDVAKSGGLATNIGVHLFDLCGWLFGVHEGTAVNGRSPTSISGRSFFAKGEVNWHLATVGEKRRLFKFGSTEINLVDGFEDLHAETYRRVLAGNGFGIEDARQAIKIVEGIRNAG